MGRRKMISGAMWALVLIAFFWLVHASLGFTTGEF